MSKTKKSFGWTNTLVDLSYVLTNQAHLSVFQADLKQHVNQQASGCKKHMSVYVRLLSSPSKSGNRMENVCILFLFLHLNVMDRRQSDENGRKSVYVGPPIDLLWVPKALVFKHWMHTDVTKVSCSALIPQRICSLIPC